MYEIEGTIACSLRTEDGAAPFHAFTRQGGTVELARQFLVVAEQVADLAGSHADVTGRHVHIWPNHLIEFAHEGLTEFHHLIVALAADREVRASFATAHRQGGEGILEGLFEAEKLQDAQVHRRVEAQSALVRADGAIELYAVTDVHLYLALVVNPGHAEGRDAFRLHDALYDLCLFELGMLVVHIFNAFQHLSYCL